MDGVRGVLTQAVHRRRAIDCHFPLVPCISPQRGSQRLHKQHPAEFTLWQVSSPGSRRHSGKCSTWPAGRASSGLETPPRQSRETTGKPLDSSSAASNFRTPHRCRRRVPVSRPTARVRGALERPGPWGAHSDPRGPRDPPWEVGRVLRHHGRRSASRAAGSTGSRGVARGEGAAAEQGRRSRWLASSQPRSPGT